MNRSRYDHGIGNSQRFHQRGCRTGRCESARYPAEVLKRGGGEEESGDTDDPQRRVRALRVSHVSSRFSGTSTAERATSRPAVSTSAGATITRQYPANTSKAVDQPGVWSAMGPGRDEVRSIDATSRATAATASPTRVDVELSLMARSRQRFSRPDCCARSAARARAAFVSRAKLAANSAAPTTSRAAVAAGGVQQPRSAVDHEPAAGHERDPDPVVDRRDGAQVEQDAVRPHPPRRHQQPDRHQERAETQRVGERQHRKGARCLGGDHRAAPSALVSWSCMTPP